MYEVKLDSNKNYIITLTETTIIPYPSEETTQEVQTCFDELAKKLTDDLNNALLKVMKSPVILVDGQPEIELTADERESGTYVIQGL